MGWRDNKVAKGVKVQTEAEMKKSLPQPDRKAMEDRHRREEEAKKRR